MRTRRAEPGKNCKNFSVSMVALMTTSLMSSLARINFICFGRGGGEEKRKERKGYTHCITYSKKDKKGRLTSFINPNRISLLIVLS